MLTIRMQRTGRAGHAQFRLVVQDSRFSPSSGRVVAYLGSYNPHAKTATLDKEKAQTYLNNGAQPSDRVAVLLKNEGVKLPKWYSAPAKKSRAIRNQDKLRRNRPAEEVAPEPVVEATEAPVEETEPVAAETPSETPEAEAPSEKSDETPAEEPAKTDAAQ